MLCQCWADIADVSFIFRTLLRGQLLSHRRGFSLHNLCVLCANIVCSVLFPFCSMQHSDGQFLAHFARKQFFLFARKVACCHRWVCKLVMLVFLVFVLLIADTLSIFIDISVSWMCVMLDCKLLLIISYQPWRLKEAEIHRLCRQKWHLFILLSEMTYHVSNVSPASLPHCRLSMFGW